MDTIVVDELLSVDVKARAVVGSDAKLVSSRFRDKQIAVVIDGEPFEAIGDARESGVEACLGDV